MAQELDLEALLSEAELAVREAGLLFADRALAGHIHHKNATDFVTEVDTGVQELMRRRLAEILPEARFMGEEQDNSGLDTSGLVWILDPVDGTTNFIHRLGHSAISLALVAEGRGVLAIIFNPDTNELYTAIAGRGAKLNGREIHVSPTEKLAEGLIGVGTNPAFRDLADRNFGIMRAVFDRCIDIRRMGAASLDFCDVACGRLDAYAECRLNPWDYAAGLLIVREAGGTVTDLRGGSPDMFTPSDIVAANGNVTEEILEVLHNISSPPTVMSPRKFWKYCTIFDVHILRPRALRRGDFFAHDINFKKIAGFSVVEGGKVL